MCATQVTVFGSGDYGGPAGLVGARIMGGHEQSEDRSRIRPSLGKTYSLKRRTELGEKPAAISHI